MIAVENRPLVVSSATAAHTSYRQVAADGGEPVETEEDDGTCNRCNEHPATHKTPWG